MLSRRRKTIGSGDGSGGPRLTAEDQQLLVSLAGEGSHGREALHALLEKAKQDVEFQERNPGGWRGATANVAVSATAGTGSPREDFGIIAMQSLRRMWSSKRGEPRGAALLEFNDYLGSVEAAARRAVDAGEHEQLMSAFPMSPADQARFERIRAANAAPAPARAAQPPSSSSPRPNARHARRSLPPGGFGSR